jgi:uncharacterized protein YjbJ (UPF0337 family)
MNSNIAQGNVKQLKGHVLSAFGSLTGDSLVTAKGHAAVILGKVQEKFGTAQEEIEATLSALAAPSTAGSIS